jgi:hypothetical protein
MTMRLTDNTLSIFGTFSDRVLELLNHLYAPMYKHVFKRYWNNSMYARMRQNYSDTDFKGAVFETNIPTSENVEVNMQYFGITVKVLPEIDKETLRDEFQTWEHKQLVKPVGVLDSRLIAFVSPHLSARARHDKKKWPRGFRYRAGHMCAVIVSDVPEVCVKRLQVLVANFLKKRVRKLLESVNLDQLVAKEESVYYQRYVVGIIEEFSLSLGNMLQCLSRSLAWILKGAEFVLREVGRQNMIRLHIVERQVMELRETLKPFVRCSPSFKSGCDPPIVEKLLEVLH